MATYIKGFWARICGFLVGVISTIFGSNSAQAAYTVKSRVLTCAQQDSNWLYFDAFDDAEEGDLYTSRFGSNYASADDLNYTVNSNNGIDLQELWNEMYNDGSDCNPACGCLAGGGIGTDTECPRPYFWVDSASFPTQTTVTSDGFTGYRVPMFVGASYVINDDDALTVVGWCYEYVYYASGCGYMDEGSAGIIYNKLADGRGSYLTDKTTNKFATVKTYSSSSLPNNTFKYVGYTSNWAYTLANSAHYSNVQCSSCAIPSGATAGMVGYGGSTTAGNTFSTDKCYFIAKGSQTGMSLLSDTSGSFYYPLVNGSLNKCYYNQNSGNGITSST